MIERFKSIAKKQKEFQRLVKYPVDTILESERNEMSEKYLFKMIEEIVELRKEFPSVANPYSKSQKTADLTRVKEELADVILFLVNFINIWKFSIEELVDTIEATQKHNVEKVKMKKMNVINSEILKIPGETKMTGVGSLSPKYIFIIHHQIYGGDERSELVKGLVGVLKNLGIMKDTYMTAIVKEAIPGTEVDENLVTFWWEFLEKELEVLMGEDYLNMKIIAVGDEVSQEFFMRFPSIHITKVDSLKRLVDGEVTIEEYEQHLKNAIN